jgi:hypothetical protein
MATYPTVKNARPGDPILNSILLAYANDPADYLQDLLFPVLYDVMGADSAWSGIIQRAAEGALFSPLVHKTKAGRGGTVTTLPGLEYDPLYVEAEEYSLQTKIPFMDKFLVQGAGDNEANQLAQVVEFIKQAREAEVAAIFQTLGNWRYSTTLGAAAKWDVATSDPTADIITALNAVPGKVDTAIIDGASAEALMNNAAFLEFDAMTVDRTAYTYNDIADRIKSRFGIENVFFGLARKSENIKQTDALDTDYIFTDSCWFGRLDMLNGRPRENAGRLNADGSLVPVSKCSVGRCIVEPMHVNDYDDNQNRSHFRQVAYSESNFVTLPAGGYVIASTRT